MRFLISVLFLIYFTMFSFGENALSILKKIDTNQVYNTIRFDGEIVIENNNKKSVKTFKAYAKGDKSYFNEFTNNEDLGTKYLKKDGSLYLYNPEVEEVIPIVGHMLKQSMMGSDMSYEDMINNDNLSDQYIPKIIEEKKFDNRDVWVMELIGKNKDVSYQKRVLWVDKESFYPLKSELYAVSGKLLKIMEIKEIVKINGKNFPVMRITVDLVRKNSKTTFYFKNIEMDIKLDNNLFSLKNLEK